MLTRQLRAVQKEPVCCKWDKTTVGLVPVVADMMWRQSIECDCIVCRDTASPASYKTMGI